MNDFIVTYATDANKRQDPLLTHATDASMRMDIWVTHQTNANKLKDPLLAHSTDAVLAVTKTPVISTQVKPVTGAKFSKNAPLYISIGGGLSAMVGLPRIATWNTLGRPAKPKKGTMGLNTETKKLEVWNGSSWHSVSLTRV